MTVPAALAALLLLAGPALADARLRYAAPDRPLPSLFFTLRQAEAALAPPPAAPAPWSTICVPLDPPRPRRAVRLPLPDIGSAAARGLNIAIVETPGPGDRVVVIQQPPGLVLGTPSPESIPGTPDPVILLPRGSDRRGPQP